MFEIDKSKFGDFVSQLRKEKGITQKELAANLFVSDKAVSKWETGQSLPDVALLVPLAESLGVTVTELLECRRVAPTCNMEPEKVEELVQKTINLSSRGEQRLKPGKKSAAVYTLCLAAAAAETAALFALGSTKKEFWSSVFVFILLGAFFGAYFFFFAKEKLPRYYDENKIELYSDGMFRMNVPGLRFTNSNWPHILKAGRFGTMAMTVGAPVLYLVGCRVFPEFKGTAAVPVMMTVFLLSVLFVPMYVVGRKYE